MNIVNKNTLSSRVPVFPQISTTMLYHTIGWLIALIRLIPNSTIRLISWFSSFVLALLPWKRNRIVDQNLDIAYSDQLSLHRRFEIKRKAWLNIVSMIFNTMRFKDHQDQLLDTTDIHNHVTLEKSLQHNRGALLLAPHCGDFLLSAAFLAKRYPITIIMRLPSSNPWRELTLKLYESMGFEVIDRKNGLHSVIRALSKNRIVIMAIDQHSSGFGIWIDFFGKPAGTITSPAIIALKKDVPVHFGHAHCFPDGHVEAWIHDRIPLKRTGNQDKDIRYNTIQFSKLVENAIKKYPESWMWMHQRWKSPPK